MRENERLVAFAADQINLCARSASMSKFRPRFDYAASECMRNLWKLIGLWRISNLDICEYDEEFHFAINGNSQWYEHYVLEFWQVD